MKIVMPLWQCVAAAVLAIPVGFLAAQVPAIGYAVIMLAGGILFLQLSVYLAGPPECPHCWARRREEADGVTLPIPLVVDTRNLRLDRRVNCLHGGEA